MATRLMRHRDGGPLRRAGFTINGVEVGPTLDDPCSPARCEAW